MSIARAPMTTGLRAKTLLGRARPLANLLPPFLAGHVTARSRCRRAYAAMLAARTGTEHEAALPGETSMQMTNAAQLVDATIAGLRARAETRQIDVLSYCDCGPVWVDPFTFSAALHELLDNSLRASKRGHPVTIDVRGTSDHDVVWQISDNGAGMPPAVLAGLGRSHRDTTGGMRHLGVAFAWAVIDEHQGLLRFESAPGFGTTTTIWIPAPPG